MKKDVLLICLFVSVTGFMGISAQDQPAASSQTKQSSQSSLQTAVVNSVVFIQHEFYIKSSDSSEKDLWRRFEKLLGRPFLDASWAVSSGAGFFIDACGTILTNGYVVGGSLYSLRLAASRTMAKALDEVYDSDFTEDERDAMKEDFKILLVTADYTLTASLACRPLGKTDILRVAAEGEPNLALLRVSGVESAGLRLAESEVFGSNLVDSDVFSLGFPSISSLDPRSEEYMMTFQKGTVKSFRGSGQGIFHNAAVSTAGSGGPVIDARGIVLGINIGAKSADQPKGAFFAIDSAAVRDFLTRSGFENILRWNARLPGPLDEPSENAILRITTQPSGATIYADGRSCGTAPLELVLPPGEYILRMELEGYWFDDQPLTICGGKVSSFDYLGVKGIDLVIEDPPVEPDVSFHLESERGVREFPIGVPIWLAEGEWTLTVTGSPALEGIVIPVTLTGQTELLDLAPYRKTAGLVIRGLFPEASLWIDGKPVSASGDIIPGVPLGKHTVFGTARGLQPLEPVSITIRPGTGNFVTWEKAIGYDRRGTVRKWTGVGLAAAGAGLLGFGVYSSLDDVAVAHSRYYDEYLLFKGLGYLESTAGILFLIAAAWVEAAAAKDRGRYQEQLDLLRSWEEVE